jgi:hypothetical protein
MGCAEFWVQPTVLKTLVEVIISCTHINISLLKANEAKVREYGASEIVPQGHRVVIIVYVTQRVASHKAVPA